MDKKEFGKLLEKRRKELGFSRKDMVEKTGIAPSSWAAYERGEKTPPLDTAETIANALMISLDALAGREAKSNIFHTWGEAIRAIGNWLIYYSGDIESRNYYYEYYDDFDYGGWEQISEEDYHDSVKQTLRKRYLLCLPYKEPSNKKPEMEFGFPSQAGELFEKITPLLRSNTITSDMFMTLVEDCAKKYDDLFINRDEKGNYRESDLPF